MRHMLRHGTSGFIDAVYSADDKNYYDLGQNFLPYSDILVLWVDIAYIHCTTLLFLRKSNV